MQQELTLLLSKWVDSTPNPVDRAARRATANRAMYAGELLEACQQHSWCLPAAVAEVMEKMEQ